MIQMQTNLVVADNSGAKTARCIKVLGGSKHMITNIGDVIVVSITSGDKINLKDYREKKKKIAIIFTTLNKKA